MAKENKGAKKYNSGGEAYNAILGGIISGELKPGYVVSEHELSEKYGIGRTPVREALKRLEGEGFITNADRKKRVYFLTGSDIEEIFNLKIAIEGMIARHAALSADAALKEELRGVLSEMQKYAGPDATDVSHGGTGSEELDLDKWLDLDKRFHNLLYAMAHNHRAETIIENLNHQWHRIRVGMSAITGHLERSVTEHLRVGHAVLEGEPEIAYEAMRSHFSNLRKYIINLMNTFGA